MAYAITTLTLSAELAFGFDFFWIRFFFVSDHADTIAAFVEFNYIHIRAHKQYSPAAGLIEIFAAPWVWNGTWVKALAFVGHRNLDLVGAYRILDSNLFLRVHFIAVLDSIDESLFQRQMDGEDIVLTEIVGF